MQPTAQNTRSSYLETPEAELPTAQLYRQILKRGLPTIFPSSLNLSSQASVNPLANDFGTNEDCVHLCVCVFVHTKYTKCAIPRTEGTNLLRDVESFFYVTHREKGKHESEIERKRADAQQSHVRFVQKQTGCANARDASAPAPLIKCMYLWRKDVDFIIEIEKVTSEGGEMSEANRVLMFS
jgi:hypothetical protein